MTHSIEYQNADPFKRKLLREIKAGKQLLKAGWTDAFRKGEGLPADVHTLESVMKWYDRYVEREDKKVWKDYDPYGLL
jgi:hypothetical protein